MTLREIANCRFPIADCPFLGEPARKTQLPIGSRQIAICLVSLALLVCASPAVTNAQPSEEGQALFGSKCYSCHNIGNGDKQGPDLKGVTARRSKEWLHEFINKPAEMNAKGDPTARGLFSKFPATVMPDQALTSQQIDSILMLIEDLTNKNQPFLPAGAKLSRAVLPTDVGGGWKLFTGRTSLQNGGVACISCHSVTGVGVFGGGTLGPDLNAVSLKYRDPELIAILQNPNFPTMATVFEKHPLTDEEIVQLFALFQDAKQRSPSSGIQVGVTKLDPGFFIIGTAAMLLVLTLLNLAWRKRLRGVREELVRRATR
jgi:mono/diheme cytochrome c family protein